MPKLQRYVQKIRRYKNKLKRLISRIGISYSEEFELIDEIPVKLLFPCHLGILFYGASIDTLFEKIKDHLNQTFDSFFFGIRNLGEFNFTNELFSKGVKKEYKDMKKSSDVIKMHPTNKFYQILINKRNEENLGMILSLTDLPIYSSSDDNILFLFGETHLKHRCSVVSTLKLKEYFPERRRINDQFEERVFKEIIHEVGHMIIGSDHCQESVCVMRFSNDVHNIDNKSLDLCDKCKTKLLKIRNNHNF